MSRIFWDTNLFIYLLEPKEEFSTLTKELRIRMLKRGDQLLTSAITLSEVLVKPTQAGDAERCRKYERAIRRRLFSCRSTSKRRGTTPR